MSLSAMIKSLQRSQSGGTLGTYVFEPAAVAPANAWRTIFTVTGGNVLMTMLIGETTIAEGTGASNLDMQIDPTAAGAVAALCAATVINNDIVGTLYTFTGVPTDGCYAALSVPGGMVGGLAAQGFHGWVVPPGAVQWRESAAVPDHAVQWYMFYVPIDRGANVT